jgi:hypothetical protein
MVLGTRFTRLGATIIILPGSRTTTSLLASPFAAFAFFFLARGLTFSTCSST